MDISDLKTFEAVARLGSMNKAAAELNTVQSNITARVRALEDELGVQLFERHPRGVITTAPGLRILPTVTRIEELFEQVVVMAQDDGMPRGPLNLGCLETTMALHFSRLISDFAAVYPDVNLTISAATTAQLVRDVAEFKLDGAFVAGPIDHIELEQEKIFSEELVLVTHPTVRAIADLALKRDLKMIVFRSGCSYRQRLETLLARTGNVITKPLEFSSVDVIVDCVAAGVGVTLLPRAIVSKAAALRKVALHPIPPDLGNVETLFVYRRDRYMSNALNVFLSMARDTESPAIVRADMVEPITHLPAC